MKYRIVLIKTDKGEMTVTSKSYDYKRARAIVERAVDTYIFDKDYPNFFEWVTPYFYGSFLANLYFFLVEETN